MIEHVPDVITWLNVLLGSLNAGGRIILAIPDRRYTFDFFRPLSTTGEMLQAMFEKRKQPSFAQIYDAFSRAVDVNSADIWQSGPYPRAINHMFTREVAISPARHSSETNEYRDCHCWVLERTSFLSTVAELRQLGFINAQIASHRPPAYISNEFHVVLMRD